MTQTAPPRTPNPAEPAGHGRGESLRPLLAGRSSVLPSTRASVGALLCLLAALLTYAAITRADRPPTTRWLVAAHDIAPGELIGSQDVTSEAIELPPSLAQRAIAEGADLSSVVALGPMGKGELLQQGTVTRGASAALLSFPVRAEHAVAGRLRAGMRVNVYATADGTTGLVASSVAVVRVDGAAGATGTVVVTVESPPEAEVDLVRAAAAAKLVLVALPLRSDDASASGAP